MTSEKTHDVAWALNNLKSLIVKEEKLPKIIVTDKDISLMNVVEYVFPTPKQFLCRFHIGKNLSAKSKLYCVKNDLEFIKAAWDDLMYSATEKEYEIHISDLILLCEPYEKFMSYVEKTWLADHRIFFVK